MPTFLSQGVHWIYVVFIDVEFESTIMWIEWYLMTVGVTNGERNHNGRLA